MNNLSQKINILTELCCRQLFSVRVAIIQGKTGAGNLCSYRNLKGGIRKDSICEHRLILHA